MAFFVAPGGIIGGTSLGNLYVRLTADPSSFLRAMVVSQQTTTTAAKKMQDAVVGMAGVVTSAVAGMAAFSVNEFAKFNKAMTESMAIMGDLSDKMKVGLERVARELARESVQSATDLANSYFFLASAGLNAQQAIGALPIVARFATAGVVDMEKATSLLANSQSALGLRVADARQNMLNMAEVADVLVKANILSDATTEQFAISLTNKAGAALKAFEVDMYQGVAVLAAFADQGVKGEEAGEALNIVLRDLQRTAVNQPTIFREMGIEVFNAAGGLRNLADIVESFEKALAGATVEQKRLAFQMLGFQDRSLSSMLAVLGTSQKIRAYEAELRKAGGTSQEVAEKQMGSLVNQATTLWHRFQDLGIEIGKNLLPTLQELMEGISGVADILLAAERNGALFSGTISTLVKFINAFLLGLRAVWTALRNVATIIADTIYGIMDILVPIGKLIWDIFKRIGAAIAELAGSFQHLFNALGNLAKYRFSQAVKDLKKFEDSVREAFANVGIRLAEDIFKNLENLGTGFQRVTRVLPEMWKTTFEDVKQQWKEFADFTLKLFPPFEKGIEKSNAQLEKTGEVVKEVTRATDALATSAQTAAQAMQSIGSENIKRLIDSRKVQELLNMIGVPELHQRPQPVDVRFVLERISFEPGGGVNAEQAADILRAANIPVGRGSIGAPALELLGTQTLQARQFQQEIEQTRAKLDILRQLGEEEVSLTEEVQKRKLEAIEAYQQRLRELQLAQNVMIIQAQSEAFGELAESLRGFAGEQSGIYKAMFAVSKAFALADAIIKIQQGMAQALALPFPANLAAMAQVVSATASIISTIQSVHLTFAGERERGGVVLRDRTYLVGEKGPELFTPSQSGSIIPNDRLGGSVQVVVNNYTDAQAEVRERQMGERRIIEVLIRDLKRQISSEIRDGRGEIVRSLENTYHLQR